MKCDEARLCLVRDAKGPDKRVCYAFKEMPLFLAKGSRLFLKMGL